MFRPDQCALAHYVAGVAVGCVIRAFRARAKAEFDAKHSLRSLVKQSEFYDFMPPGATAQVAASVFEVERRWDNLHRYRDVSSLRRWLVERKLRLGVKGDVVKHSRDAILEAALDIVTKGGGTMALRTDVSNILTARFPGARVEGLRRAPGGTRLGGTIVWDGFAGKTQLGRQDLLWGALKDSLSEDEQAEISLLMTVTEEDLDLILAP